VRVARPGEKYEDKLLINLDTKVSTKQYERIYRFSQERKMPMARLLREGALKLIAEMERA
jgi:FlaA1/EpsC-like NDP-sugar epimerase